MSYYSEKLAAERLKACYELATAAVRTYLQAEIHFVTRRVGPDTRVLELGCGYGRVLRVLIPAAARVAGIDTSLASLRMARDDIVVRRGVWLAAMDAARLAFRDRSFDLTICIQNGISAFGVDHASLIAEASRVTCSGGLVLFSSYSAKFWTQRLEWFEIQAAHGLVGEIDYAATGDGVIACKDGFRATTVSPERFRNLTESLGLASRIVEVDDSSVFCEIPVP
ncbi:MAG: class I SAM-dependent methyltransferase [Acidobacteria bacterium]|nr:class I SAM-dependent methyltransferase [Acidobacteriota bacterium]